MVFDVVRLLVHVELAVDVFEVVADDVRVVVWV